MTICVMCADALDTSNCLQKIAEACLFAFRNNAVIAIGEFHYFFVKVYQNSIAVLQKNVSILNCR
jgi:hypothetical protein